jgi:hypothetical protein
LEHRASVKRFVSLQVLNLRQSVGLLGRGISPSQGRYLRQTHIHVLSGIRTHDLIVRAGEDISCLIPRGHCFQQYYSTAYTFTRIIIHLYDGPVWPKHIVEFTWRHGLCGDSTNDPWRCTEDCVCVCVCVCVSQVTWRHYRLLKLYCVERLNASE